MTFSVSIIIPAFNAEKTLEKCLESVFSSMSSLDEVIVVNDASKDQTPNIANKFNCSVVNLLENFGAAHARNQGALLASRDVILFVDSDVLITKDNIEKIREYFERNNGVHSVTVNVSDDQVCNFFTDFKNLYMNHVISEGERSVNYIYGCFCATRRVGYISWPESLRLTEDSLWGYQQKSLGLEIHCLKDQKVIHLKKYDFFSLLKNDFSISNYFAQSFLTFNRWKTLYSNESFGHTSKVQKLSVLLAMASILTFYFIPFYSLVFFFFWLLINYKFLMYTYTRRGSAFFIKSTVWYFFTYGIYFFGISYGVLVYFRPQLKSKLNPREVL